MKEENKPKHGGSRHGAGRPKGSGKGRGIPVQFRVPPDVPRKLESILGTSGIHLNQLVKTQLEKSLCYYMFRPGGGEEEKIEMRDVTKAIIDMLIDEIKEHRLINLGVPRGKTIISDQNLRKLLQIFYQLSFLEDEGRSPKLSISVLPKGGNRDGEAWIEQFGKSFPLELESLRKLIPSLPPRPLALAVTQTENDFHCSGVIRAEISGFHTIGGLKFARRSNTPGLLISIEGPGHLTITEAPEITMKVAVELRRGITRKVNFIDNSSIYNQWLGSLSQKIMDKIPDLPKEAASVLSEVFWSGVLEYTVSFKEGGTYVILPEDPPNTEKNVKINNLCSMDWMKALGYLSSLTKLVEHDESALFGKEILDYERVIQSVHQIHTGQRMLKDNVQALAHLSRTDGCVVLDNELNLQGYGGKITPQKYGKTLTKVGNPDTEEETKIPGGMRHHSAAQICADIPGTIAFVISQDQDIRIFSSRKDSPQGKVCISGPFKITLGLSLM